jgi:hypothetical protein
MCCNIDRSCTCLVLIGIGTSCWLWSLIIFLIQRFVSFVLGPHSLMGGGVGGDFPPKLSSRGSKGGGFFFVAPLGGGFGGNAPNVKFWEKLPCKIL